MTIAEFLLARIAEDEYAANLTYETAFVGTLEPSVKGSRYDLAVRMGPERVLAECAVKRTLVEDAATYVDEFENESWRTEDGDCAGRVAGRARSWQDETLRTLAAVYADHPDYQQEWAL